MLWRIALRGCAAIQSGLVSCHRCRLPAEEAGGGLLDALEQVRANVAATMRAAAGRDAASATASAAAGRLLAAGVGARP